MARNVSRRFATMDDDERRRFALEQGTPEDAEPEPVEFPEDDPRRPPPEESRPRKRQP